MKSIKEVLKKAATLLRKFGWQKYNVGRKGGPMCAMGAINMAFGGTPFYRYDENGNSTSEKYADSLRKALGLPKYNIGAHEAACAIAEWNNHKCDTVDDVLAGFEKAIKRSRS